MAFSENAFRAYPMRTPGNVRTWKFGGGNGNTTGILLTNPTAIMCEVLGNSFDSGTATLQYATDNSTFATLPTAVVAFTATGVKLVNPTDCKSGYYRIALTGTAGAAADLVCNLIALNSTDVA